MKILFIVLLSVLTLLFPANIYAESWSRINVNIQKKYSNVKHISVDDLKKMLDNKEKFVLIDVRKPKEYNISHIKRAVNITDVKKVKISKDSKIICYCSVGYRSAKFSKKLQSMGYLNVYNLEGSIFEWANKGYDLYKGNKKTKYVHPYNKKWGALLDEKYHKW